MGAKRDARETRDWRDKREMGEERDMREKRDRLGKEETQRRRGHLARPACLASLAFLAAVLPACMMGPDYTRPDTPKADAWRLTPATAESIANLPWWELLKDAELQKLIRAALQENLDLQIAAANIQEFQAQLMIAKFDLVPSFNYSGSVFGFRNTNDNVVPLAGGAIPTGGKGGGLSLSHEAADVGLKWEVDLWGRIRRSIEAARAQLLSREENQRAVILGLVSTVAQTYFDLRGLDYEVEITKRTLKAWDESVRLSELRFKQGVIPKLDLDRFQAERAATAAQLADLERQVVQTENRLSILLGRRPEEIARGLHLTEQSMPPAVPPGLPSDLLQRRPDILKVEQDLAAANANIGIAQAVRFPQLALTGAIGGAGLQFQGDSIGPFATFKGAASLTGPIFNASALGYQVKASEAVTQAAVAQYRKTVLTAFQEVEDALIAVQKTGEQRIAQEQQVKALQSAYSLADFRYQGGRASYLDVLTAQRSLFDSELALARTRRAQLTSVVQLYKALGGGWSPEMGGRKTQPAGSRGESAEVPEVTPVAIR
jgi:multidrug efflux system outer membrane protein